MKERRKEIHKAGRKERKREQLGLLLRMLKSQQYQPVSLSCSGSIGEEEVLRFGGGARGGKRLESRQNKIQFRALV